MDVIGSYTAHYLHAIVKIYWRVLVCELHVNVKLGKKQSLFPFGRLQCFNMQFTDCPL